MTDTMTRPLIETLVRGKLHSLKESPERTLRNLVDMALHFSNGRFQKQFFEIAQEMLENENSPYYQLIYHLVSNVETERLLTFGMNVGYNSFTYDANIIRKQEVANGHNIPWCVTLELSEAVLQNAPEHYHKLLNEGKSLGIYTWNIFTRGQLMHFLPLIEMNADCAFFLFCDPAELTNALLEHLEHLNNLMLVVKYEDLETEIFSVLLTRKFLYSAYLSYCAEHLEDICSNEILCSLNATNAAFAFFLRKESCPEKIYKTICQYTHTYHINPLGKTLPFEFIADNQRIDGIISDDSCIAWFDSAGKLLGHQHFNYFDHTLSDIFKTVFPKKNLPL